MFAILLSGGTARAVPGNSSQAIILIHADTGEILHAENADVRRLIASVTKIMTALVVIENNSPDEMVTIEHEHTAVIGSSMYLQVGKSYSVRDLLFGLMLASGNDAATALAFHSAGGVLEFAQMMNNRAAQMGLVNTSFKNPHGLDEEGHFSTAADLAAITREAMKNELFVEIVSTKFHTVGEQTLRNHNRLLWEYEGTLGVKTGFTRAAGRTLVSAAERNGMRLICVTLSAPDDWRDHTSLFDWGFKNFEYINVLPMVNIGRIPLISGKVGSVGVIAPADARILKRPGDEVSFTVELPQFVYAGVREGELAGRVFVSVNGETRAEFPLIYAEDAEVADNIRLSPWARFRRTWFMSNRPSAGLGGTLP